MALSRIASMLGSLAPASDSAISPSSADEVPQEIDRRADPLSGQSGSSWDGRRESSNDLVAQLQTMVIAVRTLNETAMQQGGAVAVSVVGSDLKNAVTGLGHLLSAVNAQAMANGAAAPVREASSVIDGVEAGLVGAQVAAEQVIRNMPAAQAQRAQDASDRFQRDMRNAVSLVRESLGSLGTRRY